MHGINKFAALVAIMLISFTVTPAFAQEDGSEEAPVASAVGLSMCLAAIEAERVRLNRPDATCDADALARVRIACAGQETASLAHFRHLMEMCGMETNGLDSLRDIFEAIDCSEPANPPPTWRRRPGCAPRQMVTPPTPAPDQQRTPVPGATPAQYMCADGSHGVDRHGDPVEEGGRIDHCACDEGLPFQVERRFTRREMGVSANTIVVGCAISHAGADIRREEIERIIERITRLGTICTDEEGHHTASADEPLLCRTIWMLIERVAANGASITVLGRELADLEPRVERIEIQLADECGVSVEAWQAMSREERAHCRQSDDAQSPHHFRASLLGIGLLHTEAAVFSGYVGVRAEYEYDFDPTLGFIASVEGGYGSFGDQPGQIRHVAVGESAYFGIGAGLSFRIDPEWQVGLQLTYRHTLNPGPTVTGELEGDWVGSSFTLDPSLRWNPHPNFFIEAGVGIGGGLTFRESQGRPEGVGGFTLQPRLGIGVSF